MNNAPEAPAAAEGATRCGVDSVGISRIERLLAQTPPNELLKLYSEQELKDAGDGPGRAASLAARFAAKEACTKLFPREAALGAVGPADFAVSRDGYGAPVVELSEAAAIALGRNRLRSISLSLTHDRTQASAVALALAGGAAPSRGARWLYRLLPARRKVVLDNLRRVFSRMTDIPAEEIDAFLESPWLSLFLGQFTDYTQETDTPIRTKEKML